MVKSVQLQAYKASNFYIPAREKLHKTDFIMDVNNFCDLTFSHIEIKIVMLTKYLGKIQKSCPPLKSTTTHFLQILHNFKMQHLKKV